MTEKKLEAALAAKVAALNIAGLFVDLSLGTPVEETADTLATLSIVTDNRSQMAWEIPQHDISFTLTLDTRIELDEDRSRHLAIVDALTTLLAGWCGRAGAETLETDFTIQGEFTPAYCQLGGGQNITDRDNGLYTWSQTMTIRGIIIPSTTNQGE